MPTVVAPPPPAAATRQIIIDAAAAAFAEEGYGASLDRIATRAGVARQTLYNHFECKSTLFEEVIRASMRQVLVTLEAVDGGLRENLLHFAHVYRRKLLSPEALAMFRNLATEMPRFPELARTVFMAGPTQTILHLSRFLDKAMERGELRRDDPAFAAEVLVGMLTGYDRVRGLMGAETEKLTDDRHCERLVDCFLRAFRPERG